MSACGPEEPLCGPQEGRGPRLRDPGLNRTWLAGTGLLIATDKSTENTTVKIFNETHGQRFL